MLCPSLSSSEASDSSIPEKIATPVGAATAAVTEPVVAEAVPLYQTGTTLPLWTDAELDYIRDRLKKIAILRVRNITDVEDLVQETMLTMVRKQPPVQQTHGKLVWGIGILRNKINNYKRNLRVRTLHDSENRGNCQCNAPASPEENLLRRELKDLIADAIDQLPPSQKRAMGLLVDGLDPHEIVRRLSPARYQSVINHLYRGRKKVARRLNSYICDRPGRKKNISALLQVL